MVSIMEIKVEKSKEQRLLASISFVHRARNRKTEQVQAEKVGNKNFSKENDTSKAIYPTVISHHNIEKYRVRLYSIIA